VIFFFLFATSRSRRIDWSLLGLRPSDYERHPISAVMYVAISLSLDLKQE
jgi:hypothetical protein